MKTQPTKKQLQEALSQQVSAYLQEGGEINRVERGKSGIHADQPWANPFQSSGRSEPESRTPVNEVIAAIEARKQAKRKPHKPKRAKPKKEWIYDDFGEPVRWVWKEPDS